MLRFLSTICSECFGEHVTKRRKSQCDVHDHSVVDLAMHVRETAGLVQNNLQKVGNPFSAGPWNTFGLCVSLHLLVIASDAGLY